MTIPFLDLFKRTKEKFEARRRPAAPSPLPSVVNKPESDKLAKRVMPHAVRTLTPEPSAPALAAAGLGASRKISIGRPSAASPDFPPAVALALEPRVERVLSLSLNDVIAEMPPGYLKPRDSFDPTRRVLLKAAEVEKGLAAGRPTIAVTTLYQQMPEIFEHTVPSSDAALVTLPFGKVIDELSHLRLREDQMVEPIAPQVETPFLQVTLEESKKFGTEMAPFTTMEMPQVRLEPATASTIAAAEPEPTGRLAPPSALSTDWATLPPSPSIEPDTDRNGAEAVEDSSLALSSEPQKLLPIGTGEPAFPRVPASSGPPVPPVATPAEPMRIPFKMAEDLPAKAEVPVPLERSRSETRRDEQMLTLPLRPILESLPPIQRGGDVGSVPADAKISFPMGVIEPQLASGKVVVTPKDFHTALPAEHRNLFLSDAVEAPVHLSLSDVLANLAGEAIRVRPDQEIEILDEVFQTPFLEKAVEDAQRFAAEESETPQLAPIQDETVEVETAAVEPEKIEASEVVPAAVSDGPAPAAEEEKSDRQIEAEVDQAQEPAQKSMLELPLRPILESLPANQRAGDAGGVPADAKISFPISLIEKQLVSGKVVVTPKDFDEALSAEHRNLFLPDATEDAVQLSLSDVLANLPGEAIRVRDDQEKIETLDDVFQTPFLEKAVEDAQRFAEGTGEAEIPQIEIPGLDPEPTEPTEPTEAAEPTQLATPEEPEKIVASASAEAPPIQPAEVAPSSVEVTPKFDAKEAVAQVCALPGVTWCSVIFSDGLSIAGNIPGEMNIDGLSAVAPTMLRKLQKHMVETQLGSLSCMTVHCEKSPVTFFVAGNICLTAVHNGAELSAESRRELNRITEELSRTYSQPEETAHVDY